MKILQTHITEPNQVRIKIDFSHLNLKNPPYIFTSIIGIGSHWVFTGINSIYELTNKSCVIYLRSTIGNISEYVESMKYSIRYLIK